MKVYRPNVAALMVNEEGKLLVCERIKVSDAWQFPQGGVDQGEEIEEALKREVREEIGLKPKHYLIQERRGGYRYDYPSGFKKGSKAKYVGQEQTYFLCLVKKEAPAIDVMQEPREFAAYRWIDPRDFQENWLPEFKVEVYRAVLKDFFGVDLTSARK